MAFNDKKENIKGIGNEFNSNESSRLDDGHKIGDNLEFKIRMLAGFHFPNGYTISLWENLENISLDAIFYMIHWKK